MGLIDPAKIREKLMLQRLWQLKIGWDQSMSPGLFTAWIQFCKQLRSLNEIKVPRPVLAQNPLNAQMHESCDTSQNAYAPTYIAERPMNQEKLRFIYRVRNCVSHLLTFK